LGNIGGDEAEVLAFFDNAGVVGAVVDGFLEYTFLPAMKSSQ
jgi:hypothetical protein